MPDTTTPADPVTAYLAEVGERWSKVEYVSLKPEVVPEPGHQPEWLPDVPRLLAAVDAALAVHGPGRVVVLGHLCSRHECCRNFSITSTEAAGVIACPECKATVYTSCAGCGSQMPLESCPTRRAITTELLSPLVAEPGEEGSA